MYDLWYLYTQDMLDDRSCDHLTMIILKLLGTLPATAALLKASGILETVKTQCMVSPLLSSCHVHVSPFTVLHAHYWSPCLRSNMAARARPCMCTCTLPLHTSSWPLLPRGKTLASTVQVARKLGTTRCL